MMFVIAVWMPNSDSQCTLFHPEFQVVYCRAERGRRLRRKLDEDFRLAVVRVDFMDQVLMYEVDASH
ncbi:uncharacterized protein MYCFIDRAFT_210845 [Pseudocercospora fijiensis CIRAD86]|uniref:Uncharacterized protein n=1 Tax=Pseudocercospora fijiensis (strain CIRAD86) TaxID=383855 RepID=M3AI95_PSEFD|nr:uncharacterized protein MYCFIDRAFT_210845 [Pseudocercospora fijiensis CIRAD86]EME84301.1 hypothetical protein MYCFIDRAFT_210845 [Pseudocercospora fijiensis CIRAD86]